MLIILSKICFSCLINNQHSCQWWQAGRCEQMRQLLYWLMRDVYTICCGHIVTSSLPVRSNNYCYFSWAKNLWQYAHSILYMHTAVYAIKQTHYCRIDFRTQNETYSTGNLISSLRQRSLMTREKGEERKRPLPASDAIVIIVICLPTK